MSSRITPTPEQAVCSVVVERDGHKYVFVYLTGYESKMRQIVGITAANPAVNFNWHDAAKVCQVIRSGE